MNLAVIIPCRNEVKHIEECVRAIFDSSFNNDVHLEVIIVDGKSDDGTIELIESLKLEFPSLQMVINEKQLTPYAFNLGIHTASNPDFIQIVGARQVLSSNYLQCALDSLINDPTIGCVGGGVENVYLNDSGRIIASAMSTSFGMGLGNFRAITTSSFVDTVGTPMYRYSIFEKVGFFDEELVRNQDDEFNYRVLKSGSKILLNADISIKYYVRGNFKSLWRQFFQYGYWKVYVNKKHSSVTTFRQLIPPLFVLYLLLFPLALAISKLIFFVAGVPFVLYLLILLFMGFNSAGSMSERLKRVYTFLILHFSYGLGYLKGIYEFLLLRKKPSEKQKRLSR